MLRKTSAISMIILISFILVLSGCTKIREKHLEKNNNIESTVEQGNRQSGSSDNNNEKDVLDPGDYKFTINQGNRERYYLLHIPDSYDGKSTPLVLAFHGGIGSAEVMPKYYGWKKKSDEEGFIVAFPNGYSGFDSGDIATWNAGRCCGPAVRKASDDIGFIKLAIDDIQSRLNIDNIFATGMSNGGMFSHRLACEMSDVFSAVAAVAGTNDYDDCKPDNPISVMHIHGLQDDHILFEGGCGPQCLEISETEHTSVAKTIADWVKRNNCSTNPERVFENENGYCDLYPGCDNDVQVKLCVATDGGHSWPGMELALGPLEKTRPSQAFSATDQIWDLFKVQ